MTCLHVGSPSKLFQDEDDDWAPTLRLGHNKVKVKAVEARERDARHKVLEEKRRRFEAAAGLLELSTRHLQVQDKISSGTIIIVQMYNYICYASVKPFNPLYFIILLTFKCQIYSSEESAAT